MHGTLVHCVLCSKNIKHEKSPLVVRGLMDADFAPPLFISKRLITKSFPEIL